MRASRSLAERIVKELPRYGTAERAAGAKAYLKSDLEFLGLVAGDLRAVVRAEMKAEAQPTRETLVAAVDALWTGVFEHRLAAVELMLFRGKLLAAADSALIERLLRDSHSWALVDSLATAVMGGMVEREPKLVTVLDRWSRDDDFWVRRAAMLSLLVPLRRGGGDFARFGRYADRMLEEKEFFIRKAIGWVLRETSKKAPDTVYDWLLPRAERASGVTMREAVKYLPAAKKKRLTALYASGQSARPRRARLQP